MSAPSRILRSQTVQPQGESSHSYQDDAITDQLERDVAAARALDARANETSPLEDQASSAIITRETQRQEDDNPPGDGGLSDDEADGGSDGEFEKLKRLALRKQRADDKRALRSYLETGVAVTVGGVHYGNPEVRRKRKRNDAAETDASDSEDNANLLRIRPNPPPLYGATCEQEWRTFVNALNAYWAGMPKRIRTANKIATSSSYFKGLAATDWAETVSRGQEPQTWPTYLEYLHNLVADPANRKVNAYEKLKDIKQADGQSVRDLRSAIELLEKDIDPRSQEEEAMCLYTALKPSWKKEVLRELHGKIALREEVASVAKRYEEQASAAKKSEKNTAKAVEGQDKSSERSSTTRKKRKYWEIKKLERRRRNSPAPKEKADKGAPSEPTCYNCGEKGHIRPNCDKPVSQAKSKDKRSKKE